MSGVVFYWIGVGAVSVITASAVLAGLTVIYAALLHGRFHLIFFRKTDRRLSLASWYNARMMSDEHFGADDFPIAQRPFLLSYNIGKRRIFIMAGVMEDRRHSPIEGKHPEYSA